MIKLYEINRALRGTPVLAFNEGVIFIVDNEEIASIPGLSTAQCIALESMQEHIRSLIPDDFGFQVTLGGDEPEFELIYRDGPLMQGGAPLAFSSDEEFTQLLNDGDWDVMRDDAIKTSMQMDALIARYGRKGGRR